MSHSQSPSPTDTPRVIIGDDTETVGVTVHHRDFPEIRANGPNPDAACDRLVHHLSRTLDSALTTWRRDNIQQAIADVEQFAAIHP